MGGHRDRGLGELLAGDATEEDRRADRRRASAGTFGGHLPTTIAEARRDTGDALTALLHAAGIDTAGAHVAQVADSGSWTGPVFDRLLGEADQEAQHASERSPIAAGGGGGVGEVVPYAVVVPTAPEAATAEVVATAAPLASRLLAGAGRVARAGIAPAGEAGAYGALSSRSHTPEGAAEDTLMSAGLGGAVGMGARALGEGFAHVTSPEARRVAHREADRQRVASVRGESRGTISHRDFESLIQGLGRGGRTRDERLARAAQTIRESGVVGPFSSAGEIADSTSRAESRAIEAMDSIRSEADAAGASVPADAVPAALERYAAELDPMALGRWADVPRMEAGTWRDAIAPGERGAEMRPHPAFGPDRTLDDLLEQRAAMPLPPRIAELDRRLGAQTAQEAARAAAGEPGAVERAASRRAREEAPDRSLDDLLAMLEQSRGEVLSLPSASGAPEPVGVATAPRDRARRGEPESLSGLSSGAASAREGEQEAFWRQLHDDDVAVSPATDPGVPGEEPGAGPYRSVDPRRSAAAREAHARRVEADELTEHDLDDSLIDAWRAIGPRRRAEFQRTPHASRAEAFTQWAHDHGADVQRMRIDAQQAGLHAMQEPPPPGVTLSRSTSDALPEAAPATDEGLGGYGPEVEDALRRIDETPPRTTPRAPGPSREPGPVSLHALGTDRAEVEHTMDRDALWRAIQEAASAPPGHARGLTIPRQRAEDALRILDRTTQWTTPSGQTVAPDTQVAREMRHTVRDTIDDAIAPFLSPERAAQYPEARRAYSVARTIGDVVRPAEERAAGRSSLASAMTAAAPVIASGGGAAPAAAASFGYRLYRGREASTEATLLEALARARDAAPGAAARLRPLLERARRGTTLSAVHHALSEDPAEYTTEAERAIGASAPSAAPPADAPATAPTTDRAARRRALRRELLRRELARREAAQ